MNASLNHFGGSFTARFAMPDRVWRFLFGAFAALVLSGCSSHATTLPLPDSNRSAGISGKPHQSADDAVAAFLSNLKKVVDRGLLDQPVEIEALMGFRVVGWRDKRDDQAFSERLHQSTDASFGGLIAFVSPPSARIDAGHPELNFMSVERSRMTPAIEPRHLHLVFGPPTEVQGPRDAHRTSGGAIRYVFNVPGRRSEITFTMSGGSRYIVNHILARTVATK